jgi:hypothetical protein
VKIINLTWLAPVLIEPKAQGPVFFHTNLATAHMGTFWYAHGGLQDKAKYFFFALFKFRFSQIPTTERALKNTFSYESSHQAFWMQWNNTAWDFLSAGRMQSLSRSRLKSGYIIPSAESERKFIQGRSKDLEALSKYHSSFNFYQFFQFDDFLMTIQIRNE